jgi:lipid II:glycine glycyltransferase (peptidoglycan interpeptide bridge formation enzyme)
MKITRLTGGQIDGDLLGTLTSDSLLQSNSFASLWNNSGGEVVYWVAWMGSEVVALLPGVEFGIYPIKRFQAMPDGLGSRILLRDKDTTLHDKATSAILDAITKAGYLKVHITDFDSCLRMPTTYSVLPCSTTVIDISTEDWMPPDKKLRSELHKAERENVKIKPFCFESHMKDFMHLMVDTEQRHGRKPKYSAQFYNALAQLQSHDDRILWLWCEHDGRPVVSHICLIEGETALHWQVCYDKEFSFLKANQFMLWDLIDRLKKRGVTRLNLGASPPDAPGLVDYKSKWGGERFEYNCYVYKSWLGQWL